MCPHDLGWIATWDKGREQWVFRCKQCKEECEPRGAGQFIA